MIESFLYSKYRLYGFYEANTVEKSQEQVLQNDSSSKITKIWRKIAAMVSSLSNKIFGFCRIVREEFYDPFFKNDDSIVRAVEKDARIMDKEITLIKEHIINLDSFIKRHPDLYQLCKETYEKCPEAVASKQGTSLERYSRKYDVNNPFDNNIKTSHDLVSLKFDLEERVIFIKRNKEVYELFEKYVILEQQKENADEARSLLELTFTSEV